LSWGAKYPIGESLNLGWGTKYPLGETFNLNWGTEYPMGRKFARLLLRVSPEGLDVRHLKKYCVASVSNM
jgi:hypothetical protein